MEGLSRPPERPRNRRCGPDARFHGPAAPRGAMTGRARGTTSLSLSSLCPVRFFCFTAAKHRHKRTHLWRARARNTRLCKGLLKLWNQCTLAFPARVKSARRTFLGGGERKRCFSLRGVWCVVIMVLLLLSLRAGSATGVLYEREKGEPWVEGGGALCFAAAACRSPSAGGSRERRSIEPDRAAAGGVVYTINSTSFMSIPVLLIPNLCSQV
jgi:hypothetical protein